MPNFEDYERSLHILNSKNGFDGAMSPNKAKERLDIDWLGGSCGALPVWSFLERVMGGGMVTITISLPCE